MPLLLCVKVISIIYFSVPSSKIFFFKPMQHQWKEKCSSNFIIQYWNHVARKNSFFPFFSGIKHFHHIILFGAIDYRLKLDTVGTTGELSNAVFLSPRWKLGITAMTFRNHRFRKLTLATGRTAPILHPAVLDIPRSSQSLGTLSGESLMASSPRGFTGSPLTHLGISQGTPSVTKRSMKKGSLLWGSHLES